MMEGDEYSQRPLRFLGTEEEDLASSPEWGVVYLFGLFLIFITMSMICDEYFVAALEEMIKRYNISADVAGTVLMAAGTSIPELFAALVGLFFSDSSDAGLGTVVGSVVFNGTVIVGGALLVSPSEVPIERGNLFRDTLFYLTSLVLLWASFSNGAVEAWEAGCMVAAYVLYVAVVAAPGWWMARCSPCHSSSGGGEPPRPRTPAEAQLRDALAPVLRLRVLAFNRARRGVAAGFFGPLEEPARAAAAAVAGAPRAPSSSRTSLLEAGGFASRRSRAGSAPYNPLSGRALGDASSRGSSLRGAGAAVAPGAPPPPALAAGPSADFAASSAAGDQLRAFEEEEVFYLREIFEALDVDGLGALTGAEVRALLVRLGLAGEATADDLLRALGATEAEGGAAAAAGCFVSRERFVLTFVQWVERAHILQSGFGLSAEKVAGVREDFNRTFARWRTEDRLSVRDVKTNLVTVEHGQEIVRLLDLLGLRDSDTIRLEEFLALYSQQAGCVTSVRDTTRKIGDLAEQEAEAHTPHRLWSPPPGGALAKLGWAVSLPMALALRWTVPDCRRPALRGLFPLTLLLSCAWLAALVYLLLRLAAALGAAWGLRPGLVGVLLCATGTSVPDALASLLVAARAEGGGAMAIANAFGSNNFDALLGLGLPFLLKSALTGWAPVPVGGGGGEGGGGGGALTQVVVMALALGLFHLVTALAGFRLRAATGWLFLAAYALYAGYAVLTLQF